ncbi:S-adenosylmethionine decarboxylase family protein [Halomicroarcula sp. GCM10025817]|uniref:S-adenosylmethionine decarboxylase family protein n=1 Tax=Haloarcula TaxID=2237 RepID=UPI0023E8B12C|nr:S-adenosylmethionine decarboxylase [Halomicroarcula sp. SYNS111]
MRESEVRVCDVFGVPPAVLRERDGLMSRLTDACEDAGLTILDEVHHDFESGGEGFTSVLLLVESHLAVHTWPEEEYVALTLDTSWQRDLTAELVDEMLAEIPHDSVTVETVTRQPKR